MSSRKLQGKKSFEKETRAEELRTLFYLFGGNPLTKEVYLNLNNLEESGESEIFLFPGREGCGCIFSQMSTHLKAPTISLQYDNRDPEKNLSIEQMANDIYPEFLEKHRKRQDFFIVAYSFGAPVAIEVVKKLEAEGYTGKLIIIDSSPKFLNVYVEERVRGDNKNELDTSLLLHVSTIFAPRLTSELAAAIRNGDSWDDKVSTFLELAPADMPELTAEGLRNLCHVLGNRTIAMGRYTEPASPCISTPILLLKAAYKALRTAIDDDYGLSNITRGRVDVRDIKDSHATIPSNSTVASIINAEWEQLYEQFF